MANSKVPELAQDGRNWKDYRANLIEIAATKGWLGILSGQESNDETLRWEGRDAQLKFLLYQTIQVPLVLKIRKLKTARDMFEYLAKLFHDLSPLATIEGTKDDTPDTGGLPLEGEQAVCSSGSVKDMSTAPAGCEDGPHEQSRLVDVKPDSYRDSTNTNTSVDEVSDKSREVSDMVAVEGSLGTEATDIAASMEVATETWYLNRDGGDAKVCYQISEPANAGVASCAEAQPAGERLKLEHSRSNEIPVWDTPEAANALLEEEQNGHTSSDVENEQTGDNEEPQLTIYDPGGNLGHPRACTVSRQEPTDEKGHAADTDERRAPLEGEQARCASGCATNTAVDGHTDNSNGQANGPSGEDTITLLQKEQNVNGSNTRMATPSMSSEGKTIAAMPQTRSVDASTYRVTRWLVDEMDSLQKHANTSSYEMDAFSIAYDTRIASDACQNVRTCQTTLDSPRGFENKLPDPMTPWERVGVGDTNIPLPRNALLETTSTPNQNVIFGRASADKGSATRSIEGERAGGDGKQCNGEGNGTTSSGDIDSMRVEAATLAAESQHAPQGSRLHDDLLVSHRPPMNRQKHSCILNRPKRRRGRIKLAAGNVSKARKVENGHRRHGNEMRLILCHREGIGTCLDPIFKCWKQGECRRLAKNRSNVNPNVLRYQERVQEAFGVVEDKGKCRNDRERVGMEGKWCQMDGTTSSTRCDSKRVETRLLTGDEGSGQCKQQLRKPRNILGPSTNHGKHSRTLNQPKRRRGRIKFESRNVSRARKLKSAHQGQDNAMQPTPRHREGIGTWPDLTIEFRKPTDDFTKPSDHR